MNLMQAKRNNVTELKHYRKPMKNPILVELLDHWENLRGGRIAPMRSEIDPRQIENVLKHAFILERVADGEARIRIAGMELCALMGMEARAMPATAIIAPDCRTEFSAILRGLFTAPEIVELTLETAAPGQRALQADMLLLPMKNDLGEISRVLGCLVANGAPSNPPHRFAITSCKATRIVAPDYKPKHHKIEGFAETPQRFTPKPARPNEASHLTLVIDQ
jgi:hypothetical protein